MKRNQVIKRLAFVFGLILCGGIADDARGELRAGAAIVDATPTQFPVFVNGGMTSRTADKAVTPINARAIVVDDGTERVAIVVVDSCMMPRDLLDEAKQLACQRTQLRPDRILISATHTHTAPSCMGALGTDADATYRPFLRDKLAEAVARAEANLEPARVGFAKADAAEYTALRRWVIRPDKVDVDPFGNPTVRANMHAGRVWENVTGESGPEDPDLSLIAFQSPTGRPIATLANFSMHYFSGVEALNADYFGMFSNGLQEALGGQAGSHAPFVAMMSHGCSGDIWRRDYTQAEFKDPKIDDFTNGLLQIALAAHATIQYHDGDLEMVERRLPMRYRVPDKQRLEWAQRIVTAMGDRLPKTTEEVYAREQLILHELQSTEIVLQAIRIGDVAIATTPNETYALTGLKVKGQSPLPQTMVIELANGGDGYIPPPEQHVLGGYNTWAARSAGLEVNAEPKITESLVEMLEEVTGQPRRSLALSVGPATRAMLDSRPTAYWRMNESAGPHAIDESEHGLHATFEPGVVFYLAGPHATEFCSATEANRAAHFAGGRMRARLSAVKESYTVSLWFWNGMPADGRSVSGWLFSRGHDFGLHPASEHLGIGGTETEPGKLVLQIGGDGDRGTKAVGKSVIERWTWNQVVLSRDGKRLRVFLNGNAEPEIDLMLPNSSAQFSCDQFFFGGRSDSRDNWEGRLDEIAVFDRALNAEELGTISSTQTTLR